MATKYEFFNADDDATYSVWDVNWFAQTFTVGNTGSNVNHMAYSTKLYLLKNGSPTATLTAGIRAVDGDGLPIGSDLCSATQDTEDLTTDPVWYELVFTTTTLLRPSTKYAIVIRCPNATAGNTPRWRQKSSGGYTGGSVINSDDSGGNWAASSTQDFMFEIWGNLEGSSSEGSIFPTDDVARVSSIRHIFRPGFFRMQAGLGDLGLDIDVAETAVRAELDTAKEVAAGVGYPEILKVLGMTAEEFAEMGRDVARSRKGPTSFPAYEEQIAYEEWFQKQMEELRRMQE